MFIKLVLFSGRGIADGKYKGYWTGHSVSMYSKKRELKAVLCSKYPTKEKRYPVIVNVKNQKAWLKIEVSEKYRKFFQKRLHKNEFDV